MFTTLRERFHAAEGGEGGTGETDPKKGEKLLPTRSLRSVFFPEDEPIDGLRTSTSHHPEDRDKNMPIFRPNAPVVMSPQIVEYDRLAILLYNALERRPHRRRLHEYADTFYGKDAVDWLVGSGVFVDAVDARNALRHLLQRRIILRADHTIPLLNDALERVAPEKAKQREVKYRNMHASANRGFHDQHLYKFPAEAFCRTEVRVKVCGARNLLFRSRPHLGPFALHSKFQQRKIDPYASVQYHSQVTKTDTCENSTGIVEWENEFTFYNETNTLEETPSSQEEFYDLWIRVFDFHEILDDVELGFLLVSGKEIGVQCAEGRTWTAWHPLRPSSGLTTNDRTYGEIELTISIKPFIAQHNEWTVMQSARRSNAQVKYTAQEVFELTEDQVASAHTHSITQNVTSVLKKGVEEVVNLGTAKVNSGDGNARCNDDEGGTGECASRNGEEGSTAAQFHKTFTLNVLQCHIHRMSDMSTNGEVWAEYSLVNHDGIAVKEPLIKAKSARVHWPTRDLGPVKLRGIHRKHLDEAKDMQVLVKFYQIKTGLTIKMGEASIAINKFMPDLSSPVTVGKEDEVDYAAMAKGEKTNVRRVAAFRRNRRILVGDMVLTAVLQPYSRDDDGFEDDDDDEEKDGLALPASSDSMVLEDELYNITLLLTSKALELPSKPLSHIVFTDRKVACPLDELIWLALSKNSPVLLTFCNRMKFTNLVQSDWKWESKVNSSGGRSNSVSIYEDHSKDDVVVEDSTTTTSSEPAPDAIAADTPSHRKMQAESPTNSSFSLKTKPPPSQSESSSTPKHTPPMLKAGSLACFTSATKLACAHEEEEEEEEGEREEQTNGGGGEDSISQKELLFNAASSSNPLEDFPSRTITYTRPPEAIVSALTVKETWRLKACSTGRAFWMEIEGHTNEPTYGANMSTKIYIVGESVNEHTSKLSISSETLWISRPTLTAGLVERTANAGTTKTYNTYFDVLTGVLAKKKRAKRGAGGISGNEEEEEHVEVVPPHKWFWIFMRIVVGLFELAFMTWLIYIAYQYWLNRPTGALDMLNAEVEL